MNKITAIMLTELRLFFNTPVAYITGFVFYCQNGILFWYFLNQANAMQESLQGAGIMSELANGIIFWLSLFLLAPVIGMRLIAFEAEKSRLGHLFTAPVSDWQITLGKFTGGLLFYMILWAPVILYVFTLNRFTPVDFGPVWSSYLGIILMGSFSISVALFASSLSSNQIISAIITFFLLVSILLLSMFENMADASQLKEFFRFINFTERYGSFSEGIIDTRDIIFFVSGTLFFLAASSEVIHYRREHHE